MVSRKTNCHDVVRCVCRPESADPTLTFGCVCAAVCSFYIREAHASAKSLPAGASDTSAIVPRPTRDMRWRASFAVQLYEALGNPGFGALQPWLFDTSLQKLQPLVQRFWHVGHLGLMEKLLRFVVEHNVRLVAIEGALKGWHKAKAKAGQSASIIDAHQQMALLHEFQQRVELYHKGVRQLTTLRRAEGQPSTPTVASMPTLPVSVLELFTQSSGARSATRSPDSPPRPGSNLKSLADTSAGATPAATAAAAAAAASPAQELEEASVESDSEAEEEGPNDPLHELEAAAHLEFCAGGATDVAEPPANASPLRPRRPAVSRPNAFATEDAKITRTRAAAGNAAQRSPRVRADAEVVASAARVTKRKRAPSRDHGLKEESNTRAALQLPVARIGRSKATAKPQEDADDGTSDVMQSAFQPWRESCAEQFVQLLQHYPYQLTRAHPLEVAAAENSLESAALVVRGLGMLAASVSSSSIEAVQQELAAALVNPASPKAILQLSDDGGAASPEPEVRWTQATGRDERGKENLLLRLFAALTPFVCLGPCVTAGV